MHIVSQGMQNTIAQHPQRREKVAWNLQFHCARKSNRNRRQSEDRRTRRASEPTFLRNGISGYPKKTQCFVQILTFKSHPWCSSSNAICQQWLAKDNQNRKTTLQNKYPSRSVDAAIPLGSAQTAQELRNTIELQHTTVEHIALMLQFQCT